MTKHRRRFRRGLLFLAASALWLPVSGFFLSVQAAQLSSRSLYVSNTNPSAVANHSFSFTHTSGDAVGSVLFEYCTNPFMELSCDAPTGLDTSGAALTQQSGEIGFALGETAANRLVIGRSPTSGNAASSYSFSGIVNPSSKGTFFVRITTYASQDASGPNIDYGAVASSVAQSVQVGSEVPPILKFCVGLSLGSDCTTTDENVVDLGDLTPTRASAGKSQMLAATNAQFGLAIAAYGTTLTSGNNIIPALASPTVSAPGNAQFGFNLVNNSNPDIGQDPVGSGVANPTVRYGQVNRYTFTNGDTVATSPAATDTRKFTASYIANVTPSQPPGVYTATITYVCTATF